jgi:DNA gyrase/topoisomerase IV subunit B
MDPQVRTLLQVRAEDHTEADLMFTTLMGDQGGAAPEIHRRQCVGCEEP